MDLSKRPRRLRRTPAIRALVRETRLSADQLVYPLFVCEGTGVRRAVSSMPGVFQLSVDEAVREAKAPRCSTSICTVSCASTNLWASPAATSG